MIQTMSKLKHLMTRRRSLGMDPDVLVREDAPSDMGVGVGMSNRRLRLYFNGRVLAVPFGGIPRAAKELITAIDRLITRDVEIGSLIEGEVLLTQARSAIPNLQSIRQRRAGLLRGIIWEQIELPIIARDGVLISFSNYNAIMHPRNITMIHSAQSMIMPESYSLVDRFINSTMLPLVGKTSKQVLTVSQFSKEILGNYHIAAEEKIIVTPNGIDHIYRHPGSELTLDRFGLTPGRFVLAQSSTHAHKNIRVLFEAFSRPELSDLTLVCMGPASSADFAAAGMTPPTNSVFVGPVSDSEMRGLMEAALCFAFPSLTEGFGLPPLEAMAVGCPAVVAPCGAIPEICAEAAIYALPKDATSWCEAITKLRSNADLRQQLIKLGLGRAAKFTWEDAARKVIEAALEAAG
jgi:glycosyltransferase involved in cell wall biosynthesis